MVVVQSEMAVEYLSRLVSRMRTVAGGNFTASLEFGRRWRWRCRFRCIEAFFALTSILIPSSRFSVSLFSFIKHKKRIKEKFMLYLFLYFCYFDFAFLFRFSSRYGVVLGLVCVRVLARILHRATIIRTASPDCRRHLASLASPRHRCLLTYYYHPLLSSSNVMDTFAALLLLKLVSCIMLAAKRKFLFSLFFPTLSLSL